MAVYTANSVIVGTTGASGANGFLALITAANTAAAAAVTTAKGATGLVAGSIVIGEARMSVDTQSNILEMLQTVTYQTFA